jgi:hypothetical protein
LQQEYSGAAFDDLVAKALVNMDSIKIATSNPSPSSSSPSPQNASPSPTPRVITTEGPQRSSNTAGVVTGAVVGSVCGAIVTGIAIYFAQKLYAKKGAAAGASGPAEAAPPVTADIFTDANSGNPAEKYRVPSEARPVGEGVEETMEEERGIRATVRSAPAMQ